MNAAAVARDNGIAALARRLSGALLAIPPLLWVALLVVAPNVILVLNSVWTNDISGIQHTFTLENYSQAFESDTVATLLIRSILIAVGAACLASLVAFPMAYLVVHYFRDHHLLLAMLIIIPLWVSFLMRVFAWKIILGENGVLNGFLQGIGITDSPSSAFLYSPYAVAIVMTYVGIPYVFLCSYTLLERIPPNLYEAASDCGASPFRMFRTVAWPIARPAVAVGFMIVFVIVFSDYVTPALVGGFNGTMIGSIVLEAFGSLNNWPYGAALSIIIVGSTVIVLTATSVLLRKRYVLEEEVG